MTKMNKHDSLNGAGYDAYGHWHDPKSSTMINDLGRINRAYNLLYTLGVSESNPPKLSMVEVNALLKLAAEANDNVRTTEQHREIAAKLNPAMLRYVATGVMKHE